MTCTPKLDTLKKRAELDQLSVEMGAKFLLEKHLKFQQVINKYSISEVVFEPTISTIKNIKRINKILMIHLFYTG